VIQIVAPQSTSANTIPIATNATIRFSRLNGDVGLKRPYPSVANTASVCAAFD
jgi:hypothetical protein